MLALTATLFLMQQPPAAGISIRQQFLFLDRNTKAMCCNCCFELCHLFLVRQQMEAHSTFPLHHSAFFGGPWVFTRVHQQANSCLFCGQMAAGLWAGFEAIFHLCLTDWSLTWRPGRPLMMIQWRRPSVARVRHRVSPDTDEVPFCDCAAQAFENSEDPRCVCHYLRTRRHCLAE